MEPGPRWRVAPGQSFLWDDYDSEVVLFDSVSGSTHLLNPSAAEALLALIREPEGLTVPDVRTRVIDALDLVPRDLPEARVAELLLHLDNLGLIVSEAPPIATG